MNINKRYVCRNIFFKALLTVFFLVVTLFGSISVMAADGYVFITSGLNNSDTYCLENGGQRTGANVNHCFQNRFRKILNVAERTTCTKITRRYGSLRKNSRGSWYFSASTQWETRSNHCRKY